MPRRLLERLERRGTTSTPAAPQAASSSQGTVAAGGNDGPSPAATVSGSPEEIIAQIQQDFASTEQSLLDQQTSLANQIGDSFDGYVASEAAVQAWYDLAVSETEALGARTIENARQYYRSVVDNIDHGDDGAIDDAVDDLYDLIYDDAFEEYYDTIYDDGFETMYDTYYDGLIDDAYNTMEYGDWYDIKSNAYDAWYDAKSDVYDAWSDSKSDVYDDWSDINSAFYSNDFDVNDILRLDA